MIVQTIYKDVTWTVNGITEENVPMSHIHRKVRPIVIRLACEMGDSDCLNQARTLLDEHLNERTVLHPDIRELAYYYG